ncbi:MAG: esterase family protein [Saprospiraceae bacterium]|nr:esterase family protein [Saprospiraceae bacterium]
MKTVSTFFCLLIHFISHSTARVDTVQIYSTQMSRSFPALIFQPDVTEGSHEKYPVLYLLHGHSSDYSGWNYVEMQLRNWADQFKIIIVCPDGNYASWYVNSPVLPQSKFDTYISEEVRLYVERHYPALRDKNFRGITGVSMGGHGAIYLALKHPGLYGLAGSISGALDILPFPGEWNLEEVFGRFRGREDLWQKFSCLYLLDSHCHPDLRFRIDCGTDDFFIQANRQFQSKLKSMNLNHEYHESPGGHDIDYWIRAFEDQLRYFARQWTIRPRRFTHQSYGK